MTRSELLEAYVTGRIGRRAFIRGLMGVGISTSVAATHAAALQPRGVGASGLGRQRAPMVRGQDFYDFYYDGGDASAGDTNGGGNQGGDASAGPVESGSASSGTRGGGKSRATAPAISPTGATSWVATPSAAGSGRRCDDRRYHRWQHERRRQQRRVRRQRDRRRGQRWRCGRGRRRQRARRRGYRRRWRFRGQRRRRW